MVTRGCPKLYREVLMVISPLLRVARMALLGALTAAFGASPALAWSERGHAIVGGVADLRLHSPRARQQVQLILQGESLAEVASWLDYVRPLKPGFEKEPSVELAALAKDPDSVAFVSRFANLPVPPAGGFVSGSSTWHYVNQPLDSKGYGVPGLVPFFVGKPQEPDVVLQAQDCIRVLRGNGPIEGAWGKRNALRSLVHLVGDMHQPLHMACGYLDTTQTEPSRLIVRDTQEILKRRLESDRGGNSLLFPKGTLYESLHSYWDDALVERAVTAARSSHRFTASASAERETAYYTALLAGQRPGKGWSVKGDLEKWPVLWTPDAVAGARVAYDHIQVLSATRELLPNRWSDKNQGYRIALRPGYDEVMAPIVEDQLARGGYRLAQLLEAIWR